MGGIALDRRGLVRGMFGLGAAALVAPRAFAGVSGGAERRLAFRNVHTGEKVDARYFGGAGYDAQGLAEIDHGLRDWRTGTTVPMDRELLNLLGDVRDRLGVSTRAPFDLICGYRSPHTNALLKAEGGARSGVASRSQHLLGKATDVRFSGRSLDTLRDAARSLGRGGVGYYPRDGFCHVDTGPVRTW